MALAFECDRCKAFYTCSALEYTKNSEYGEGPDYVICTINGIKMTTQFTNPSKTFLCGKPEIDLCPPCKARLLGSLVKEVQR